MIGGIEKRKACNAFRGLPQIARSLGAAYETA